MAVLVTFDIFRTRFNRGFQGIFGRDAANFNENCHACMMADASAIDSFSARNKSGADGLGEA